MRRDPVALLMLFAAAAVYGAIFSVNKIAAESGWPALSFAFLQSVGAGAVLLAVGLASGSATRPTRRHLTSFLVIGAVLIGLPLGLLTYIAPKLPAGVVTLVLALSPPLTFLFAALARIERFRLRGLLGVLIGFAGVVVLVSPGSALAETGAARWFLLALLAPVMFALGNVLAGLIRPPATASITMATGVLLGSGAVIAPLLAAAGQPLWPASAGAGLLALLLAVAINTVFYVLFFEIVRRAGPTFFSLFNYLAVLAGIAWGAALFGERPDAGFWTALALMLAGVYVTLSAARPAAAAASPSAPG